jgi:hypothetical protein
MSELFEQASENLGEILDHLDQLASGMENVLLHLGKHMNQGDLVARSNDASKAKALLKKIGFYEDQDGESSSGVESLTST